MELGATRAAVSPAVESWPEDSGDDEALYLITSGTTGEPKLVVRTQINLMQNACSVGQALDMKPGAILLPVTPFFHANGFSNGMLLPILSGACLILITQYFPGRLVELIKRHGVEIILASPFVFANLKHHNPDAANLRTLRYCISSGAALPEEIFEHFRNEWGVPIRQLYGSSETGTISVDSLGVVHSEQTAGRPLSSVEVQILSDQEQALSQGQIGQIAVRSPAMMKGYWSPNGILSCRTSEGFFLTGDLGMINSEGNLKLQGRIRNFINISGNKVAPEEIEGVLRGIPGVLRCRVSATDHPRQTQTIAATLFVSSEAEVTQAKILEYCRQSLAEYKIPHHIYIRPYETPDLPDKHGDLEQKG